MALILASSIGACAYCLYQSSTVFNPPRPKKHPPKKAPTSDIAERYMNTGTYGDVSQIAHILSLDEGFIVDEKRGTDLSGAPCRWLYARNGCAYKTYDLTTKYM